MDVETAICLKTKVFGNLISFLAGELPREKVKIDTASFGDGKHIILLKENVIGTYYPAVRYYKNGDGEPEYYDEEIDIDEDYIEELIEKFVAGYEEDVIEYWHIKSKYGERKYV